jgi:hypothetical protein
VPGLDTLSKTASSAQLLIWHLDQGALPVFPESVAKMMLRMQAFSLPQGFE